MHLYTIYTDNSSSKVDSLAFMKLLMLFGGIVKVIMTILPFTQLSHSELLLLNQARPWFLKIDPVQIISMCVCMCVYVCVSTPEAINN